MKERSVRPRVTLEPALEAMSGLWTEERALQMACVFERWARQLRVKVRIARADRRPRPVGVLKRMARRRLRLN